MITGGLCSDLLPVDQITSLDIIQRKLWIDWIRILLIKDDGPGRTIGSLNSFLLLLRGIIILPKTPPPHPTQLAINLPAERLVVVSNFWDSREIGRGGEEADQGLTLPDPSKVRKSLAPQNVHLRGICRIPPKRSGGHPPRSIHTVMMPDDQIPPFWTPIWLAYLVHIIA